MSLFSDKTYDTVKCSLIKKFKCLFDEDIKNSVIGKCDMFSVININVTDLLKKVSKIEENDKFVEFVNHIFQERTMTNNGSGQTKIVNATFDIKAVISKILKNKRIENNEKGFRLKFFFEKGRQVNVKSLCISDQITLIHRALRHNNLPIFKLLVENGFYIEKNLICYYIDHICYNESQNSISSNIIEYLIDIKVDPHYSDNKYPNIPLEMLKKISYSKSKDCIDCLLQKKVDPTIKGYHYGKTSPLLRSIALNNKTAVKRMINLGSFVNYNTIKFAGKQQFIEQDLFEYLIDIYKSNVDARENKSVSLNFDYSIRFKEHLNLKWDDTDEHSNNKKLQYENGVFINVIYGENISLYDSLMKAMELENLEFKYFDIDLISHDGKFGYKSTFLDILSFCDNLNSKQTEIINRFYKEKPVDSQCVKTFNNTREYERALINEPFNDFNPFKKYVLEHLIKTYLTKDKLRFYEIESEKKKKYSVLGVLQKMQILIWEKIIEFEGLYLRWFLKLGLDSNCIGEFNLSTNRFTSKSLYQRVFWNQFPIKLFLHLKNIEAIKVLLEFGANPYVLFHKKNSNRNNLDILNREHPEWRGLLKAYGLSNNSKYLEGYSDLKTFDLEQMKIRFCDYFSDKNQYAYNSNIFIIDQWQRYYSSKITLSDKKRTMNMLLTINRLDMILDVKRKILSFIVTDKPKSGSYSN